ncbi:MAG: DUF4405 domain-containing protein [Smithellaceae bacterium]|nr:DUF4405 domain-containing protein [Smithellaceae bacterium]
MGKIKFHNRGFTSMLTAFSFAVMSISGVLLFIVPQGRIAEWTDWRMLGLTKTDWGNIHITTSLLFLIAGIIHTWYNWGALIKYLSRKREEGLALKTETVVSVILVLFFVLGAIYKLPPLSSVLTLNSYIKNMWIINKDYEPPLSHAELLTLKSFSKKLNIDLTRATEELNKNGINFKETESLGLIAKNHGLSPVQVYQFIKQLEGSATVTGAMGEVKSGGLQTPVVSAAKPTTVTPASEKQAAKTQAALEKQQLYTEELVDERFEGRGMGRKTLAMICEENGLDLALARKKLAARQLVMKDDETLKEAATRFSSAPMEIMKVILVGEPVKK